MTLPRRHFLALIPAAALFPQIARATSSKIYVEDGVAVDGSDVVAYFTKGAPTPGSADITHDWMGATWRFETTENRDAFAADPEAYAPQYGGYCAYAVSKGSIAPTIPEAWTIVDGKLYLNFSLRAQELWSKDIPGNIAKANANWPGVLG